MTTLRLIAKEYAGRVAPEDFTLLAASALGRTKEFVFREPDHTLSSEEETALRSMLARRVDREPVAYLLGEKEFFGLPFFVTRDTLVPRPETELLVEEALSLLSKHDAKTVIADIGTGSGAIVVSLAHSLQKIHSESSSFTFVATDISSGALHIAKRNAEQNGVAEHIDFFEGNFIDPIPESVFEEINHILILANLPYLSRTLYESASDDARLFEPESALVADEDGLALYIELLDDIARRKKSRWRNIPVDGLFEISPEQEPALKNIFFDRFPSSQNDFLPDLSGRTRVFWFRIE